MNSNKKNSRLISRVLYPTMTISWQIFIIYLSNLPPGIERATLNCRYTWFCNPKGRQHLILLPNLVSSYLTFSPLP